MLLSLTDRLFPIATVRSERMIIEYKLLLHELLLLIERMRRCV